MKDRFAKEMVQLFALTRKQVERREYKHVRRQLCSNVQHRTLSRRGTLHCLLSRTKGGNKGWPFPCVLCPRLDSYSVAPIAFTKIALASQNFCAFPKNEKESKDFIQSTRETHAEDLFRPQRRIDPRLGACRLMLLTELFLVIYTAD